MPSTRPTGDLAMTSDLRSPSWVGTVLAPPRYQLAGYFPDQPVGIHASAATVWAALRRPWHGRGPDVGDISGCNGCRAWKRSAANRDFMAAWRDTSWLTTISRRHVPMPVTELPRTTELPTGIFAGSGCPTLVAARPSQAWSPRARRSPQPAAPRDKQVNPSTEPSSMLPTTEARHSRS